MYLKFDSRCLFQDEVVAVAEKAVLQISDLLDWIADPKEISWDRGLVSKDLIQRLMDFRKESLQLKILNCFIDNLGKKNYDLRLCIACTCFASYVCTGR